MTTPNQKQGLLMTREGMLVIEGGSIVCLARR